MAGETKRPPIALLLLLTALLLAGSCTKDDTLQVYTWPDYIPDAVLDQFTRETGIEVAVTLYDSNEALLEGLRHAEKRAWDVAMPPSALIRRLRAEGLLARLDKNRLLHRAGLDPRLMGRPFDPDNDYSLPFLWGAHGIAVNSAAVDPATVQALADLWRPDLAGKLLLPDSMRVVLGVGLKVLGYSLNDGDPEHLRLAYEKIRAIAPNVVVSDSRFPSHVLAARQAEVGIVWNGEARAAMLQDQNIRFIYPREGAGIWLDCLVIPKDAKHPKAALAFIDFLLRPDIAARVSAALGYATAQTDALGLLPGSLRANPLVYPPREVFARYEIEDDAGEDVSPLYEKYWEMLKEKG